MKSILEIVTELDHGLKRQREKWFEACLELITDLNKDRTKIEKPSLDGTTEIIMKSFQVVHVLSFIHMQRYSEDIGDLTRSLCEKVCGSQYESCVSYIDRYTTLKKEYRGDKFNDQFLKFSEDISLSIVGTLEGMLLARAIDATVMDFYTRNIILAAHAFEDSETANKLVAGIKKLHGVD